MSNLPIWDAIKTAFRHFFGHLTLFEAAAWPWLAILALWKAVAVGLGLPEQQPVTVQIVELAWQWITDIAVAVAWHRAILLDEPAPGRPRFGRAEFRFLAVGLTLTLGMIVPFLPAAYATGAGAPQAAIAGWAMLGAIIASIVAVLAARCYLALPGAAIGSGVGLVASWRRTRGNGWRLFWGVVGSALPGSAVVYVWDALANAILPPDSLALALAGLVTAGFGLAGTTIVTGFLSFSYLWFDRRALPPVSNESS
jgi:hypothetical protein